MSVALVIQQELRMSHIVIYGMSGAKIFFHIISQKAWFKKSYWTQNVFWFSLQFCLKQFLL